MKIFLFEPFFSGSHSSWAKAFKKYSQHEIRLFTLAGKFWKWRMFGGAVSLAKQFLQSNEQADLIVATDMLDLATFLALSRKKVQDLPIALYFHENQITYPWSPSDPDPALQRNNQYGFINYTSALAADQIFFNSQYHQQSFITGLQTFLRQFPDHRELDHIPAIEAKSQVLFPGVDLKQFDLAEKPVRTGSPILLWNHRWEYDKNPSLFFQLLFRLKADGLDFRLLLLGEAFRTSPAIFETAQEKLKDHIIHTGYVENKATYAQLLWQADILLVTANQDFFGISCVEAIYCNCHPILPKRLAYPEHIPAAVQEEYYYDHEEEAYEKLKKAVRQINSIRASEHYQNFVAHYDWSNLGPIYDSKMSSTSKLQ